MASKSKKNENEIAKKLEKTAPIDVDKTEAATGEIQLGADTSKTSARGKAATAKKATAGTSARTPKKSAAVKKADDAENAPLAKEGAEPKTQAAKKATAAKRTTASATAAKKTASAKSMGKTAVGAGEEASKDEEKISEATPKRKAPRKTTTEKTAAKKAEVAEEQAAIATEPERKTAEPATEPLDEMKTSQSEATAVHATTSKETKLLDDGYPGAWWREDGKASSTKEQAAKKQEKGSEEKQKEQEKQANGCENTSDGQNALTPAGSHGVGHAKPPVQFPAGVKRSFFSRLLLLLVVAAVLCTSVLIYILRPTTYIEKTDSIAYVYCEQQDATLVSYNGKSVGEIEGKVALQQSSAKGNVSVALAGGTLYLVRNDTLLEISDEVLDFALAAEGGAFAYRTAEEELYWRSSKIKAEASRITDACRDSRYFLSPDGKELVYTRVDEDGVAKMEIESYSGKEPFIENRTGLYPIAISNGSRFVYYKDEGGSFYVFDSSKEQRVLLADGEDEVDLSALTFNRDFTELMFERNGGTVFYVKGEPRQMGGASAETRFTLLPNHRAAVLQHAFGVQYMVKSFYKNYVVYEVEQGKRLAYFDRKGELMDISFVDSTACVTVTDKGVYYIATNVSANESRSILYRCKNGSDESERISWDVRAYCTNVDGSRLIFVDEQSALYLYRNDKKEPQRLLDKVNPEGLSVTADDLFCFYREDGELMVSDNGREPRVLATDVSHYFVDGHTLYYLVDDGEGGYDLFANYRNQRKSTQLLS